MMMNLQEKKVISIIVAVAIIISLSFYAGMEYQSYRIGKKISEAFSSFGDKSPSKSESEGKMDKKDEKQVTIVQPGSTHTMTGSNKEGLFSVSIGETSVGKKEIEQSYAKHTAKNSFTMIDVNAENIGKTPAFIYTGKAKLILSDGTTFLAGYVTQVKGCISCSMNPGSKETESVIFDANISEEQLVGAKIEIDDVQFIIK